jgi:hypothetical protein
MRGAKYSPRGMFGGKNIFKFLGNYYLLSSLSFFFPEKKSILNFLRLFKQL